MARSCCAARRQPQKACDPTLGGVHGVVEQDGDQPDYETALSYSSAKSDQLSFLQGGAWKEQGIKQFIEGQYRPGFGAFKKEN